MFIPDDIQNRVDQRPFVPFRIVTGSGQMFDIFHPDMVMVGRRFLILGTASPENPRQFDTVSQVAVIHVTAMTNLPAPVPTAKNGQS